MNQKIESKIEPIGQQLVDAVPSDHLTAWLYGEAEERSYCADIFYRSSDHRVFYVKASASLRDDFYEWWIQSQDAGPEPWVTATFTVKPTGEFQVDYTYEDLLKAGADASVRRKAWLVKHTGSPAVIYPPR